MASPIDRRQMINPGETVVLLGLQWGDEGKGKLIDALCAGVDLVVRYQGGHNAGHTVICNTKKHVLHLLPCGALHKRVRCVIAHGVALSLGALIREIDALRNYNNLSERLAISSHCPLLLTGHQALDEAAEKKHALIGTTRRGIGPAYEDFYARRSLLLKDVFADDFIVKLTPLVEYHNFLLKHYYDAAPLALEQVSEDLKRQAERIAPLMTDTVELLQKTKAQKKTILFEGAQGCRLDIAQGLYPYVTSSHPSIGGVFVGSGLCHKDIDRVFGVLKAYATRVGEGPFLTEQKNADGARLHKLGREFGATTGRARRCGWLDLVDVKRTARMNGVDALFMTKVDVLDQFEEIKICTAYSSKQQPIYTELSGWQQKTSHLRHYDDLPPRLRDFLRLVEEIAEVPVKGVSVGSAREQLILH